MGGFLELVDVVLLLLQGFRFGVELILHLNQLLLHHPHIPLILGLFRLIHQLQPLILPLHLLHLGLVLMLPLFGQLFKPLVLIVERDDRILHRPQAFLIIRQLLLVVVVVNVLLVQVRQLGLQVTHTLGLVVM